VLRIAGYLAMIVRFLKMSSLAMPKGYALFIPQSICAACRLRIRNRRDEGNRLTAPPA
jgi:hypothetical protein